MAANTTFAHDQAERGRAFSVFGAVSGAGGAIGLVLGGYLVDALSWRWCLYINVAIAVAALIGALAFVRDREPRTGARSLDIAGAVTIAAGLSGVVYGLGNSASHGWPAAITWAPLAAGVLLVSAFIIREHRTRHPLLPLSVILDRDRGAAYLGIGISGVGSFAIFLYLSYYLQQTLHYSALKAGLAFLPFAAVLVVGAGVASPLLARTGPRPLIPLGCLLDTASLALLTRIGEHSSYVAGVLPSVLLAGLGVGFIIAPAQNVATSGVGPQDSGVASAMVNTLQQVGGSLGLAIFTTISASAVSAYASAHASLSRGQLQTLASLAGYHTVFWVAAAIFAAGAVLTAALFRPRTALASQPAS